MLERLEVGSIVIIVVIEIKFAGASQVIPHFKMLVLGVECLFLSVIVSTRTCDLACHVLAIPQLVF